MTAICPATYERPGGRDRGDRIVRCHLPPGHPYEHEEDGTDVTWDDDAAGCDDCPPDCRSCPKDRSVCDCYEHPSEEER